MAEKGLSIEDIKLATKMLNQKVSLGDVAKHFHTNKPGILKAIGIWNTEVRKFTDPDWKDYKYQMIRGRVMILPKSGKKPKGEGYQVK